MSSVNGTNQTTTDPQANLLFAWSDYFVFAVSLAMPLAIGVFFYFYKRKEHSTEDFLVGNRSMNYVAVALSILASLLNGSFVIGSPAEMHYNGTEFAILVLGLAGSLILVAHLFIPRYQKMKFTSAYEYVENRFNYPTRVVASSIFCLSVVVFLAVVLYVPALAFAQVTQLNLYFTIIVTGVICTIYTTIGGIKAVVWTDALQMVILLVGLIAVAILGSIKAGGSSVIWQTAVDDGRIIFNDFSVDPRERHSFWTQSIGAIFTYLGLLVSNQMMVQRYMSVATARQAQAAVYITLILFIPLAVLIVWIGLAMHATYNKCDPLVTGRISTGDQIAPYYIMDVLGGYPGTAGLLTASVFAAALSSVSSVINALAAVCLEDFICPAVKHFKGITLPDNVRRKIAIVLVVLFGAATIGLSFVASTFTSKVAQATGTIWGVIGGPLAGIFVLGFYVPICNSAGAISGMIGGLIFTLWISVGNIVYSPTPQTLPVGICRGNLTASLPLPNPNATMNTGLLMDLYNVSYTWYGMIGVLSCMLIAIVVSLFTGGWKKSNMASIDPDMMNIACCQKSIISNRVLDKTQDGTLSNGYRGDEALDVKTEQPKT